MHDPALHLFIDDQHVRNLFAIRRTFGRLRKHPEPLVRDGPGRVACWASALREPEGSPHPRYRLWYLSMSSASAHEMAGAGAWGRGSEYGFFPERYPGALPETSLAQIKYAHSDDGWSWTQPELGLFEDGGSRRNSIVMDGARAAEQTARGLTNIDAFTVVRDEAAPPAQRYKLVGHWETVHVWDNVVSKLGRPEADEKRFWAVRGKYLAAGPDGLRWEGPLKRVADCVGGDYGGITRDQRNGRWWFNERAATGPILGEQYVRTAGLRTSDDLHRWPATVEQVLPLGEYEDFGTRFEHHGMTPFNYGDMDLGFLELSIKGRNVAILLASHRDGQPWRLVNGHEPVLAIGAPGDPDERLVGPTRNPPFRIGDDLVTYYNARSEPRAGGPREGTINAATLRLDGFAGLTVDTLAAQRHNLPACVQTQPLAITQPLLELNIEGHGGTARAGLYDESLKPLPGCGPDECEPIAEDAVRAAVRWRGRADLREFAGRKAIVMVQMRAGTLWAVRV